MKQVLSNPHFIDGESRVTRKLNHNRIPLLIDIQTKTRDEVRFVIEFKKNLSLGVVILKRWCFKIKLEY